MLIYIDEDYLYSIIDELITLDDFVPPSLIPIDKITERNNWLKNNDKQVIMHMNRLYKGEFRTKSDYGEKNESFIFVREQIKEFIEDYPQYSKLIKDPEKFDQELNQMKLQKWVER